MSDDHWHRPLSQIRAGELTGDTGQTSGMTRREAISGKSVGADIFEHLRVDGLGRPAKRKFAKRGQVRFGEEMAERSCRLVWDVNLPLLEALD